MFGLTPKLPVTEEERQWVDEGFRRLEKLLGRRRMIEAEVILPTAECFPDPYEKTGKWRGTAFPASLRLHARGSTSNRPAHLSRRD